MSLEFARTLRDIPVYPAAATYEFHGELTKLASNETPWEPHPQVIEAINRATHALNRYPDPEGTRLRRAIANRHDLPAAIRISQEPLPIATRPEPTPKRPAIARRSAPLSGSG